MVAKKNIIKKVQIGVNTPSLDHGMQLKDSLGTFLNEEILPEIDRFFNSFQNNETDIIRFENIYIEISIEEKDSMENIKSLIVNEIKNKIVNNANFIKQSEDCKITSPSQKENEAFLYFLEHGKFPWWFEIEPNFWDEFFNKINQDVETLAKLKSLLLRAEIRKRLIYQFDNEKLQKIVFSILNVSKRENFEAIFPQEYRNLFWEAVLHYSLHENEKEIQNIFQNIPAKDVRKLLQISKKNFGLNISLDLKKIQNRNTEIESTSKTEKLQKDLVSSTSEEAEKDGILIHNAGLVLLHPFLKMFFEKMGFLSEKAAKIEKIDEAIHALHYLATGKEQAYEHELVFEKFLCNIPFHYPVNRHILLTKEQKMACEILLEAVLGHWTALKSNSTEILQNEFLQREGKLTISEEKQNLFIQRKTQDILLDKLPWNMHLVKIPWKKKILFVEW